MIASSIFGRLAGGCVLLVLLIGCGRNGSGKHGANEVEDKGLPPASRPGTPHRVYQKGDVAPGFPDRAATAYDWETTRNIRHAIMSDPELAPAGSNVVIATEYGRVKLTGRVGTKQEQRAIVAVVEKQTGELPASNEVKVQKPVPGQ